MQWTTPAFEPGPPASLVRPPLTVFTWPLTIELP